MPHANAVQYDALLTTFEFPGSVIEEENASMDPARLLAAYDDQLRTEAETPSALAVVPMGPLRLANFGGGRGFVTYRELGTADGNATRSLVSAALAHFLADPGEKR